MPCSNNPSPSHYPFFHRKHYTSRSPSRPDAHTPSHFLSSGCNSSYLYSTFDSIRSRDGSASRLLPASSLGDMSIFFTSILAKLLVIYIVERARLARSAFIRTVVRSTVASPLHRRMFVTIAILAFPRVRAHHSLGPLIPPFVDSPPISQNTYGPGQLFAFSLRPTYHTVHTILSSPPRLSPSLPPHTSILVLLFLYSQTFFCFI